jgi:DNA-binding CsgD family transcriptional regulator
LSSAPTEAEAHLPYAVLGDLLDPAPREAMSSLSGPLRNALEVALFRAPSTQGATDQLAVSTAFLRLLRHLATDQNLLLAVDDIQWCDGPSMRVMAFALHRLASPRVRVIATFRVPSPAAVESTLRNAVSDAGLQRLEIGPLSRAVIDDLLLHRLERPLRRPELEHVYRVSEGNPFFALEIGRFILQHPAALRAGEPLPVPSSLADALKDRVANLSPATRDVLVAMAALARPDERLLRDAGSHSTAAIDEAANAQVVKRSGGRLRFTHPLLASVIYWMADPAGRRKLHLKLAGLVTDPEESARHLALAATGPDAHIADALEEAARFANVRGAPDSAARLAQQASELTPSDLSEAVERRRVMTADYLMRAGDVPAARVLLEAVLRSAPPGKRPAEALRLLGTLTLGGEDLALAERLLTEALSQAGDDVRAQARIQRDVIRILIQQGKYQEAFERSVRFHENAARLGDPALLAVALRLMASTERGFRPLSNEARETAVALAEDRISLPIDDSAGGIHPLMEWAVLLKFTDDFAHARVLLKRVLVLTEGRDESLRAPVLFHLAEMECWTGDWLLAAVYVHECENSVIHSGHRAYARLPLNAKALLHCCRGEFDAARAAAEKALSISTTIGDEPYRRRALATLGSTELAAGDAAAANRYFDSLRARGDHRCYAGLVRCEGDEVDALLAVDRPTDAEAVAARIEGWDDPWPRAVGARIRGLLAAARGDLEASMGEFDGALTAHDSLAMPSERARTLLAYGAALRRAKQKRPARERLEEALEIFNSLGAVAWIQRAESELRRIAPAPAGVSSLTPTETRVAELVASGRTNKEVAAELFLSVKTVEANLSRVYAKLSVRSRTELAARLTAQRQDGAVRSKSAPSPFSTPR